VEVPLCLGQFGAFGDGGTIGGFFSSSSPPSFHCLVASAPRRVDAECVLRLWPDDAVDVTNFDAVEIAQRLFAGKEKPVSGPAKPIRTLSCDKQRLDDVTGVRTVDAVDLLAVEGNILQVALEFLQIESVVDGRRRGRLSYRGFACGVSGHRRFRPDYVGNGRVQLHKLLEDGHGAHLLTWLRVGPHVVMNIFPAFVMVGARPEIGCIDVVLRV